MTNNPLSDLNSMNKPQGWLNKLGFGNPTANRNVVSARTGISNTRSSQPGSISIERLMQQEKNSEYSPSHSEVEDYFNTRYLNKLTERTSALEAKLTFLFDQMAGINILVPMLAEVRKYLFTYPELIDLVGHISNRASQEFPQECELSLEIFHSRESDDKHLSLYIRHTNYTREFLEKLELFSEEFEEQLGTLPGLFLITTDLKLPRSVNVI